MNEFSKKQNAHVIFITFLPREGLLFYLEQKNHGALLPCHNVCVLAK